MSPYGMDKNMGGDSPENVKWVENCVQKVMGKMKPGMMNGKAHAIAICKDTFKKMKGDQAKAEIEIDFILSKMDKEI